MGLWQRHNRVSIHLAVRSMAKTKPGTRVAFQLDTRIALEAIILNRLQLIPEGPASGVAARTAGAGFSPRVPGTARDDG